MRVSGMRKAAIKSAAASVGVRAEIDTLNKRGTIHKVKLYPIVTSEMVTPSGRRRKGDKGNAKYQRVSTNAFTSQRRVNAVCWHGFRDFFRACFMRAPNAVFRTAIDTWCGSEDFEARYKDSGHHNIGAPIAPVSMVDACECDDMGQAN